MVVLTLKVVICFPINRILAITSPKKKDHTRIGYAYRSQVINLASDKILIAIPIKRELKKPRL